jgi:hypothetical protein
VIFVFMGKQHQIRTGQLARLKRQRLNQFQPELAPAFISFLILNAGVKQYDSPACIHRESSLPQPP